ncbi:hypothetical protein Tco_0180264 [Tanacetum coccineum]
MISLTIPLPVASTATAEAKGFLTKLGAQVKMQGGLIHDHMGQSGMRSSPRGQTDAQRAALWHAIRDTQMENQELQLQVLEERRVRLELVEIVASIKDEGIERRDV